MKEILKNAGGERPVCIRADDIAALAKRGLDRALAARQTMTELSAEQAGAVGGGVFLSPAVIAGGIWVNRALGGATLPSLQTQFA